MPFRKRSKVAVVSPPHFEKRLFAKRTRRPHPQKH